MGNTIQKQIQAQVQQQVQTAQQQQPVAIRSVSVQNDQCAVKQVEYNQLQVDAARKASEIERCNPEATNQRKLTAAQEEYKKFAETATKEKWKALEEYYLAKNRLQKIVEAIKPTENYLNELEAQDKGEQAKLTDLEQIARRERRKFLDGGPQDGTPGLVPGVQTRDDKVVLAFWICYGAAFAVGIILLLKYLGPRAGVSSWTTALRIIVPSTMLAYAVAYYAISTYA
jgi:hypothetical protein